jgi:plastocyanin
MASPAPASAKKARWTMQRWVIVVASLALPLLYTAVVGLAWLSFGPVPIFVGAITVLALANVFVPNRWLQFASGLVAGLFAVLDATHDPDAWRPDYGIVYVEFVLTLLVGIAAFAAGVTAAMGKARVPPPWRAAPLGLLAVALAVGILGGTAASGALLGSGVASPGAFVALTPDATIRIDAQDFAFATHAATIPANGTIRLDVVNHDGSPHAFGFEAASVAGGLPPSKTTTFWFKVVEPGAYQIYCPLHAERAANGTWSGMVGTITVTDGRGAST